jgi:hypothetical protein
MARVNTFEMLWMEEGTSASPELNTLPDVVAMAIPNVSKGTFARNGMFAGTDPVSRCGR